MPRVKSVYEELEHTQTLKTILKRARELTRLPNSQRPCGLQKKCLMYCFKCLPEHLPMIIPFKEN